MLPRAVIFPYLLLLLLLLPPTALCQEDDSDQVPVESRNQSFLRALVAEKERESMQNLASLQALTAQAGDGGAAGEPAAGEAAAAPSQDVPEPATLPPEVLESLKGAASGHPVGTPLPAALPPSLASTMASTMASTATTTAPFPIGNQEQQGQTEPQSDAVSPQQFVPYPGDEGARGGQGARGGGGVGGQGGQGAGQGVGAAGLGVASLGQGVASLGQGVASLGLGVSPLGQTVPPPHVVPRESFHGRRDGVGELKRRLERLEEQVKREKEGKDEDDDDDDDDEEEGYHHHHRKRRHHHKRHHHHRRRYDDDNNDDDDDDDGGGRAAPPPAVVVNPYLPVTPAGGDELGKIEAAEKALEKEKAAYLLSHSGTTSVSNLAPEQLKELQRLIASKLSAGAVTSTVAAASSPAARPSPTATPQPERPLDAASGDTSEECVLCQAVGAAIKAAQAADCDGLQAGKEKTGCEQLVQLFGLVKIQQIIRNDPGRMCLTLSLCTEPKQINLSAD